MAKEIKYNDKICDKCKNVYTPISSTQKWCYNCLTKRCKQCGNEFQVKNKSKYEKSLFCSRECKGKYRSEHYIGINGANYKNGNRVKQYEMQCDYCKKLFFKEGNQYQKWTHQFCSRDCQKHYYREHNERWLGENSPRWKGGCDLDERTRFMQTPKYREWRKGVFARDHFTCQICKEKKSGRLNAHHIKAYKDFPNLRLDINNGITLCNECHRKLHSNKIELDIQSELTQ